MEELIQIGYTITGFTIVVLLLKRDQARQTKYAILLLLLWFSRFLALYLKSNVDLYEFPFLVVFDQSLLLLDGVFLFWYVKSLNSTQKIATQLFQLIPFFISFALSIFTFIYVDTNVLVEQYLQINANRDLGISDPVDSSTIVFLSLVILINVFFVFKSIRLLRSYKELLLNNISNLLDIQVYWLNNLIYFLLLFSFIPLVLFSISYIFQTPQFDFAEKLLLVGLLVSSIFFSLNIITQKYLDQNLLLQPNDISVHADNSVNSVKDDKGNKEKDEEISRIFATLTEYMIKNEAFKNEKLSLQSLAQQIDIKPAKLSVAINTMNKTNFHEYINSYRIEAIKNELYESNDQIIIIAYRNGFNSKSTFNTAFKKHTEMTPSQYRKASQTNK